MSKKQPIVKGKTMSLDDFISNTGTTKGDDNWATMEDDDEIALPTESISYLAATYGENHSAVSGMRKTEQNRQFNSKGPYIAEISNLPVETDQRDIFRLFKDYAFIGSSYKEFPGTASSNKKVQLEFRDYNSIYNVLRRDGERLNGVPIFIDAAQNISSSSSNSGHRQGYSSQSKSESEGVSNPWARGKSSTPVQPAYQQQQQSYGNNRAGTGSPFESRQQQQQNRQPTEGGYSSDISNNQTKVRQPLVLTPRTKPIEPLDIPKEYQQQSTACNTPVNSTSANITPTEKINPFGDASPANTVDLEAKYAQKLEEKKAAAAIANSSTFGMKKSLNANSAPYIHDDISNIHTSNKTSQDPAVVDSVPITVEIKNPSKPAVNPFGDATPVKTLDKEVTDSIGQSDTPISHGRGVHTTKDNLGSATHQNRPLQQESASISTPVSTSAAQPPATFVRGKNLNRDPQIESFTATPHHPNNNNLARSNNQGHASIASANGVPPPAQKKQNYSLKKKTNIRPKEIKSAKFDDENLITMTPAESYTAPTKNIVPISVVLNSNKFADLDNLESSD